MEAPDAANAGASVEQQSQGSGIADAFSEIGQIESGNHLNVTGSMRQETVKCPFLDERADDTDLTGIRANSRR